MEYSIFKDAKPKDTVKRIKKILKKHGIETEVKICEQREGYNRPYSVRVCLSSDNTIGTNGKGTSLENALASGYAEFMERLQNLLLCSIKKITNSLYVNKKDPRAKTILDSASIEILEKYIGIFKSEDEMLVHEFYEVLSKKTKLISEADFVLQGSNGMCAGNTKEEALVQGLCEICERYSLREVFSKKIQLPEINPEDYKKYGKISDLLQWYKDFNYQITVKDASLNKQLPVVCVVFKDIENNVFHTVFGSNPSLPIAIERCLTEFAQGFDLRKKSSKVNKKDLRLNPYFYKKYFNMISNELSDLPWMCSFSVPPVLEHNDYFDDIFFSQKSDYEYRKSTFIDLNKKHNNKKLLLFLIDRLKNLTNEIYIKDCSYLNFPTFTIYIPYISTELELKKENLKKYLNYFKVSMPSYKKTKENIDLKTLKDFLLVSSKWGKRAMSSFVLEEYMLLLCAIIEDNKDDILNYCEFLIDQNLQEDESEKNRVELYHLIKDYYSTEKSQKYIESKYSKTTVKNFFNLTNSLSISSIIQLIDSHICLSRPSDEHLMLYDKIAKNIAKEAKKKKNETKKLKNFFNFICFTTRI